MDMGENMKNVENKPCKENGNCEKFTAEIIEMIWRDLHWSVSIIDKGITVAEEKIKIVTIKKEIITTSNVVFAEFETIRLSAPKGRKYAIYICDEEMEIEMIKSD